MLVVVVIVLVAMAVLVAMVVVAMFVLVVVTAGAMLVVMFVRVLMGVLGRPMIVAGVQVAPTRIADRAPNRDGP